jgi:tetratricopeptide (TPR) repeat protein
MPFRTRGDIDMGISLQEWSDTLAGKADPATAARVHSELEDPGSRIQAVLSAIDKKYVHFLRRKESSRRFVLLPDKIRHLVQCIRLRPALSHFATTGDLESARTALARLWWRSRFLGFEEWAIRLMLKQGNRLYRSGKLSIAACIFEEIAEFAFSVEMSASVESDVARALFRLGDIYTLAGASDTAFQHYTTSKAIFEGVYGTDSIPVVEALLRLAKVSEEMGSFDSARTFYADGAERIRRSCGEWHPFYSDAQVAITRLEQPTLTTSGDSSLEDELLTEGSLWERFLYSTIGRTTCAVCELLVDSLRDRNDFESALRVQDFACGLRYFSSDTLSLATSLESKGQLECLNGNPAAGIAIIKYAVALIRSHIRVGESWIDPPNECRVVLTQCLDTLSHCFLADGQLEAATACAKESDASKAGLGVAQENSRCVNSNIAGVMAVYRNDYSDAIICFSEALESLSAVDDSTAVMRGLILKNLSSTYLKAGDAATSERFRDDARDVLTGHAELLAQWEEQPDEYCDVSVTVHGHNALARVLC